MLARRHVARALGTAGVWGLLAVAVTVGWQRCAFAALLRIPCPGCGTTRALKLLASGDVASSVRMQPLAVPILAAGALLALATVWTTLVLGAPLARPTRLGRAAIGVSAFVYAAAIVLWGLRWFGWFGGPVTV